MIIHNPYEITLDKVMGGSSSGNVNITSSLCTFFGSMYVKNGGFCMVLFSLDKPYKNNYICFKYKGDTNVYKLIVMCNDIMYQHDFNCSITTTHHHILLKDLIPTIRGIPVSAPRVNKKCISSIGIMISKLDENGKIIYKNDIDFNINFIL